jgi:hypothetical protein
MRSKHSVILLIALISFTLTFCGTPAAYGAPPSDPCSLLTQAQVSAVFGVNVEPAQHIAPRLCQWSAPNQPNSMNAKKVTVVLQDARAFSYAKTPITQKITTTPASGIGDDAVYSTLPGVTPGLGITLNVKKGDSYFAVHVYGFTGEAKAMAMEKTLALEIVSKL